MLDIINRIFFRDNGRSKEVARERLRLVLIHDRASVSPNFLNELKEELIRVIREYMDIDEESLVVNFENEEESVALVANIPIRGFRRAANE
ncbi:MAG: cell division topological specificity factor MinE [Syntrophomonadaceae bacterium]|nr:cell division topological specificity factor MinE [Syntrophomonadaceae bacterium]MDD3022273.1 cell division topological specificity factor MinE [Syntrophomonadaceae bacterium]